MSPSPLPCRGDLEALGVVADGRYLDRQALREHMGACPTCMDVFKVMTRTMAKAAGARGGRAGRGAAKRRGGPEHYRALALRSWSRPE